MASARCAGAFLEPGAASLPRPVSTSTAKSSRRNGRGWWGYAPACCGRLCPSVPSPTLVVRRLPVTKDGSRTTRPAPLMELPRHASSMSSQVVGKGRSRLSSERGPCPRQGASRCSRHAEMPSRPCLRSGQAARASLACRESSRGRGCALGFMAATFQRKQFSRRCAASSRDKFFSLPGSPLRCDRKRCGPPIPRRPDHNKDALARPCSTRKEKTS